MAAPDMERSTKDLLTETHDFVKGEISPLTCLEKVRMLYLQGAPAAKPTIAAYLENLGKYRAVKYRIEEELQGDEIIVRKADEFPSATEPPSQEAWEEIAEARLRLRVNMSVAARVFNLDKPDSLGPLLTRLRECYTEEEPLYPLVDPADRLKHAVSQAQGVLHEPQPLNGAVETHRIGRLEESAEEIAEALVDMKDPVTAARALASVPSEIQPKVYPYLQTLSSDQYWKHVSDVLEAERDATHEFDSTREMHRQEEKKLPTPAERGQLWIKAIGKKSGELTNALTTINKYAFSHTSFPGDYIGALVSLSRMEIDEPIRAYIQSATPNIEIPLMDVIVRDAAALAIVPDHLATISELTQYLQAARLLQMEQNPLFERYLKPLMDQYLPPAGAAETGGTKTKPDQPLPDRGGPDKPKGGPATESYTPTKAELKPILDAIRTRGRLEPAAEKQLRIVLRLPEERPGMSPAILYSSLADQEILADDGQVGLWRKALGIYSADLEAAYANLVEEERDYQGSGRTAYKQVEKARMRFNDLFIAALKTYPGLDLGDQYEKANQDEKESQDEIQETQLDLTHLLAKIEVAPEVLKVKYSAYTKAWEKSDGAKETKNRCADELLQHLVTDAGLRVVEVQSTASGRTLHHLAEIIPAGTPGSPGNTTSAVDLNPDPHTATAPIEKIKQPPAATTTTYVNPPRQTASEKAPGANLPREVPLGQEMIGTSPQGLVGYVNQVLENSASAVIGFRTSPEIVMDYLRTIELPLGISINSDTIGRIMGDHFSIAGSAQIPIFGKVTFNAILYPGVNGVLRVTEHTVKLPLLARSQQGRVENVIKNLDQVITGQINKRTDPAWQSAGFRIAGNEIVLDFKRK